MEENNMDYGGVLLVVTDLERAKEFYGKYLGLEVEVDFGANVTLTGGISLQTLETWQDFIGDHEIKFGDNDKELFFEADDYDGFISDLDGLELVHPPLEHRWGQRCVRFYDPDRHIIEVGEKIAAVAERFRKTGMTIPGIAERMGVDEKYVEDWLND